jgi:MoaA/NifB/PqqE/SkfB family radical SAM enzyme
MTILKKAGMKSISVTGGGEPLLHPEFDEIMMFLYTRGIKIGLVTNGIDMTRWPKFVFQKAAWVRVSVDSERDTIPKLYPDVNFGVSYIPKKDWRNDIKFQTLLSSAGRGDITYLRVSTDIFEDAAHWDVKDILEMNTLSPIIFQDRHTFTRGTKECWMHLIRPVVDADGLIYPCCGATHARFTPDLKYPAEMCLGDIHSYLSDYLNPQTPFDGSKCYRCYYSKYNEMLSAIKEMDGLKHIFFV